MLVMATEIEAKMKVDDLNAIRLRLKNAGAQPQGSALEENNFFDTPQNSLRAAGKGLRTRVAAKTDGSRKCTVTMKGPLQKSDLKSREETEFRVDDPDAARQLLENLGYQQTLSFQKRRESWTLQDCKIELDEMPYLGTFVEIEADSDQQVMSVRQALGLSNVPLISKSYVGMLAEYLQQHQIHDRVIHFPK